MILAQSPADRPAVGAGDRPAAGPVRRACAGRGCSGSSRSSTRSRPGSTSGSITTVFAAEQTLTSDTVPVNVDAVLFWMVYDPEKAALEVQDYKLAVSWAAQTALRDIIGRTPLTVLLRGREQIEADLQKLIDERSNPWGVTVQSVEMRDVIIPESLQDAMSREAQAAREKEARIILGQAEVEIAHLFDQASQVLRGQPDGPAPPGHEHPLRGPEGEGCADARPQHGRRVDGPGRHARRRGAPPADPQPGGRREVGRQRPGGLTRVNPWRRASMPGGSLATPRSAAASAWNRWSSGSSGWFFLVQSTAWSNNFRASAWLPCRQRVMARKNQSVASPPLCSGSWTSRGPRRPSSSRRRGRRPRPGCSRDTTLGLKADGFAGRFEGLGRVVGGASGTLTRAQARLLSSLAWSGSRIKRQAEDLRPVLAVVLHDQAQAVFAERASPASRRAAGSVSRAARAVQAATFAPRSSSASLASTACLEVRREGAGQLRQLDQFLGDDRPVGLRIEHQLPSQLNGAAVHTARPSPGPFVSAQEPAESPFPERIGELAADVDVPRRLGEQGLEPRDRVAIVGLGLGHLTRIGRRTSPRHRP